VKTAPRLEYLRHSALQTFQGCGRKFELEYLTPTPRIPQGAFHGGTAVHEAIEWAEKESIWKREDAPELLEGHALARFIEKVKRDGGGEKIRWAGRKTKQYPTGEDEQWWYFMLGVFTKRWLDIRRLWDFEGVKVLPERVEMTVRSTLPTGTLLSSKIDALVDIDGEPMLVDWKTGQKGGSPVFQLATYAWGIRETMGIEVKRGKFVYLRGPQIDTLDLTSYLPLVPKMYGDLERAMEAGVFMIQPSNFCISCPVRLDCEYGRLLPRDDLPEMYR
jgi:hypothetical protein